MYWILIIIAVVVISLTALALKHWFNNGFYRHLFGLEEVFDGELDFIRLAKNILLKVIEETSASAGILYWFDETRNEFKLKALSGIPIDQINEITRELRKPKGILEKIQAEPVGLILANLTAESTEPAWVEMKKLARNYTSLITIPLAFQKQAVGVVVLFKAKGVFKKNDFVLLTTFAPRSAVRLESARLYQIAKETAQENAKLYVNISKLYQKATLDELTGLYNRNFFMQRIREEIKKAWRFRQSLSLIFLDLDFFKAVNDKYGHQIGDQLLSELGEFVKKSIRDYDIACRFGGEEFVILLPQTTLDNAFDLADRLRDKIADRIFCASTKNLKITASFGVSVIPEFLDSPNPLSEIQINLLAENMVAWADDALYQAKKAGRNQVISHIEL